MPKRWPTMRRYKRDRMLNPLMSRV
jgi:hypothetical protein